MRNKIVADVSKKTKIVRKIITDEFRVKPSKITPVLRKGFVNQVFLAETKTTKLIVRMQDSNSLDEYKKEVWAANRAIEKFIPTPKILKIGVFDGKAFSIQEYVQGVENKNLSVDEKVVWKKLGEYARRIHTIEVGGFGLDFRDMTQGDSKLAWLRYLNYNIESLNETDELLKLNVLTKNQSAKAREIFENLKSREFVFGLNHGDLSLKNTIVDAFGTIHLIDWGSSEASIVPHHDLIQLLKVNMQENNPDDSEIQAFLDGYGIDENEYQSILPDLEALLLLRAFDKLRWAIDWKIAELKDYIFDAQETVKRVLNK